MDTQIVSFTAHDRCDRCNSQALVVAKREGLADLMFCMHHGVRHEEALIANGWEVIQDTETYESYRGVLDVSPV